jgi:ElaB/YqjD/DUF883 family membrane-anchored ribosome-binding protein
MSAETQEVRDQLVEDFKKVIGDAEELLKVTASATGAKVDAVRERAEENLRAAHRKLDALESEMMDRTRAAAKATDTLVHENPWQAVAIAGAIGLLFGMLSGRR